uniref:penicillin acylase family protein n=1 Tax=Xanthomonas fragariae TaxID=48664 RepID=UPI0019020875
MRKWLGRLLLGIVVLALAASVTLYLLLRGSLPQLDGASALAGIAAPVNVQRDGLGVVTIDAASQIDAMRAPGYVHAEERHFEMDLMRRAPAGALSE